MPNWCLNDIRVEPISLYDEVVKDLLISDDGVDFSIVSPAPDFTDTKKAVTDLESPETKALLDTVFPDWYVWRILHWGTKWNGGDHSVYTQTEQDFVYVTFSTAWSPPSVWFKALCEVLVKRELKGTITMTYLEPGNQIAGKLEWVNGVFTMVDYSYESDEYRKLYTENYGEPDDDDDIVLIDASHIKE